MHFKWCRHLKMSLKNYDFKRFFLRYLLDIFDGTMGNTYISIARTAKDYLNISKII